MLWRVHFGPRSAVYVWAQKGAAEAVETATTWARQEFGIDDAPTSLQKYVAKVTREPWADPNWQEVPLR